MRQKEDSNSGRSGQKVSTSTKSVYITPHPQCYCCWQVTGHEIWGILSQPDIGGGS